jgi:hypothetical protein
MFKKFLLASVAAASLALATPASAAIVGDLGVDPNLNVGRTPGLGTFNDEYTFSLDAAETLTIVAILNTYPLGPNTPAFISNFMGEIVAGTPASPGGVVLGPELASSPCGSVANCQSLGGIATLAAGDYFLDFSGDAGATAAYGGTINTVAAVPEASTWAMMLLGFFGLGVVSMRKRFNGSFRFA